jgi:hypothetical protein
MRRHTANWMIVLLFCSSGPASAGGSHHAGSHWQHHNHHRHNGYQPHFRGHYYNHNHRHDTPWPAYVDAALLGSTITSSLYHSHHGTRCYADHGDGSGEVIGCHRIERLRDGTQRRLEVPLSECY